MATSAIALSALEKIHYVDALLERHLYGRLLIGCDIF